MKKAAFCTLGCKVNQYETEAMEELFEKDGYEVVPFDERADVYVINTCSVTHISDRKSRQMIRRAVKLNPEAIVAVCGCYAQTAPDDIMKIEGVDIVLGTRDRNRIVDIVREYNSDSPECFVENALTNRELEPLNVSSYTDHTRAYIKVQDGCSQFCSYCIIPYARGPIRSRDIDDVLAEIKVLASNGFKEIILTGIHIASYGKDHGGACLSELLRRADAVNGIERIRLSSIEPMTLNKSFVDEIRGCEKLCHHFHLSLQSGCDETLKRMNRRYTSAQYKAIADGLRDVFPDAAITTDIMVGFPGETDAEFDETLRFIKDIDFADAHIFMYSPRKGTPAAGFENQVPHETKEKRSKAVEAVTSESRKRFTERFRGQEMPVLFEREAEKNIYEGKTGNYITVRHRSDHDICGQILSVPIIDIV